MKTYINETFFKVLNYKSWKTDIIFIKNQGKFKSIAAECKKITVTEGWSEVIKALREHRCQGLRKETLVFWKIFV